MAKLTNTQRNYLHQRIQVLTTQLTNAIKKKIKPPAKLKIICGRYPTVFESGQEIMESRFPSRVTARDVLLLLANQSGARAVMSTGKMLPASRLAGWYTRIRNKHNENIRLAEAIEYAVGDSVPRPEPVSTQQTKLNERVQTLSLKYQDIVLFDDPNPRTVLADFTRDGKQILASI